MKIIVAGAGHTGITVATRFSAKHDVVLVDSDPKALAAAEESMDLMTFHGNVKHRSTLKAIDAGKAAAFIAVTGSDTDNIVSAGLAKALGARVAIARVDDDGFYESQRGADWNVLGIDAVLCATRLAAQRILASVAGAGFSYVGAFAMQGLTVGLFPIGDDSPYCEKELSSFHLGPKVRAAAIVRDGFLRQAGNAGPIVAGDQILISGDADAFLHAWATLVPGTAKQRAMVIGDGEVASIVAAALAQHMDRVDVVASSKIKAEIVSASLEAATVVYGDARQKAFLRDMRTEDVDHFLAVSRDDELNLVVALLARRLGAKHLYALARQPGHAEVFAELGVQGAAGVFEVLAHAVADVAVTHGLVQQAELPDTRYALVEWRLMVGAQVEGITVGDLPTPPEAQLIGVGRGTETLMAGRGLALASGDRLVFVIPGRQIDGLLGGLNRFNETLPLK